MQVTTLSMILFVFSLISLIDAIISESQDINFDPVSTGKSHETIELDTQDTSKPDSETSNSDSKSLESNYTLIKEYENPKKSRLRKLYNFFSKCWGWEWFLGVLATEGSYLFTEISVEWYFQPHNASGEVHSIQNVTESKNLLKSLTGSPKLIVVVIANVLIAICVYIVLRMSNKNSSNLNKPEVSKNNDLSNRRDQIFSNFREYQ